MRTLLEDMRYGLRLLLKRPGFTAVALLTLALGVGANTAIFSVVNTVLLRPLPFKDAERLVAVYETAGERDRDYISYPNLEDYRAQNRVFEELASYVPQSVNWTGTEQPDRVRGAFVSSQFFPMLGAQAAHGRTLVPADDAAGSERVVILQHDLWQRRFGGDRGVLGRAMTLNGEPFQIVGVMPEGFQFPMDETEVWIPAQHWPNFVVARSTQAAFPMGRLKPGVTLEAAQAEMAGIAARLAESYPEANRGRGINLVKVHDLLVEDFRPALLILLGAVGLILLIACANIANLLLARGTTRLREVAVRAALGASRLRLVRQLLTETVLLSIAGGVLGLLLAMWGVDLLMALSPGPLPGGQSPRLDARVLLFALSLSILTGFIFGLMPALQLSKPDLYVALKDGRSAGEGAARGRLRGLFVVAEVALSLVLLVGAGLLINSFYRLLRTSPGFAPENLLTMEYRLPKNKYPKGEQQWEFHRRVVERVRELPGVKSAAVVRGLPFSGNGGAASFTLPDRPAPAEGQEPRALLNLVGPGYFETVGIPLVKGRLPSEQHDGPASAPVVLVNRTLAEHYWPGQDPLGKQMTFPEAEVTATVVGVVGDAKQYELAERQEPQVYGVYSQQPIIFATLVVRTAVEPMSMANTVREAVWSVDKDQPVWKVRTVEDLLRQNVATRRFIMSLMAGFAGLALLLTSIGLYGVLSYSVSQRTQEIGIRMALGAQQRHVLRLVISQGMTLALVGVAVGVVAAVALTRVMSSLLFGVSATDPATYAGVAALLTLIALLACYVPARRATKVDPMVALRYE